MIDENPYARMVKIAWVWPRRAMRLQDRLEHWTAAYFVPLFPLDYLIHPPSMSSMKKQHAPKRTGTAFWLADQEGDLLRAIATAEDRTLQAVLRRALSALCRRELGIPQSEGSNA